jgi:NADPH2:quinone reductase
VKVLAAGVSLPDVLAREGVHPETPRVPYTPGWDLVGTVDRLGEGVTGFQLGRTVAAMLIHGCYAQYVCLPHPPEIVGERGQAEFGADLA